MHPLQAPLMQGNRRRDETNEKKKKNPMPWRMLICHLTHRLLKWTSKFTTHTRGYQLNVSCVYYFQVLFYFLLCLYLLLYHAFHLPRLSATLHSSFCISIVTSLRKHVLPVD